MKNVLAGFREFILRGNAIDLAVGVVIGAAFSAVVKAIVDGLITPLIAAIVGKPDLSKLWNITLRHDGSGAPINISFGLILNAVVQLILIGAAVYFVIVLPMNRLAARRAAKKGDAEPPAPAEDVVVLREIRDLLAAPSAGAAVRSTAAAQAVSPDADGQ